jgi:hypothetical protein
MEKPMPLGDPHKQSKKALAAHLRKYAQGHSRAGLKAGDIVVIADRETFGIPADLGAGDVAVVVGDDPHAATTSIVCLHANGLEMKVSVPTAALAKTQQ